MYLNLILLDFPLIKLCFSAQKHWVSIFFSCVKTLLWAGTKRLSSLILVYKVPQWGSNFTINWCTWSMIQNKTIFKEKVWIAHRTLLQDSHCPYVCGCWGWLFPLPHWRFSDVWNCSIGTCTGSWISRVYLWFKVRTNDRRLESTRFSHEWLVISQLLLGSW